MGPSHLHFNGSSTEPSSLMQPRRPSRLATPNRPMQGATPCGSLIPRVPLPVQTPCLPLCRAPRLIFLATSPRTIPAEHGATDQKIHSAETLRFSHDTSTTIGDREYFSTSGRDRPVTRIRPSTITARVELAPRMV